MRVVLLGPVSAESGGDPLRLGGLKQRAVFALLALNARRVVPLDRFVDELWPEEPPSRATLGLQSYVSRLRRVLSAADDPEAPRLLTRPPGWLLDLDPALVDVVRFEELLALARGAPDPRSLLAEALALTFGTFAVAHLLLRSAGLDLFINAPGVARSLAGAAVHLAFVAVLGVAAGWLLRGAVAGIAAVLGVFYLLPVVGLLLPDAAARAVLPWLPGNAAAALREPASTPEMLPSWAALLVLAGYAVGAVFLAAVVVRHRDI